MMMRWIGRKKNNRTKAVKLDILVSPGVKKVGEKEYVFTVFTLRYGLFEKISKTGYVILGFDGTNVRFAESDKENGLLGGGNGLNTERKVVRSYDRELYKWAMLNGGEYVVQHDTDGYYIEGVNPIGNEE